MKSKYSEELVNDICNLIRDGNSIKDSCILSGLSEKSYYTWQKGEHLTKEQHEQFLQYTKRALADFKKKQLAIIRAAAMPRKNKDGVTINGQWQAAAWLLERKFKNEFSSKQLVDQNNKGLTQKVIYLPERDKDPSEIEKNQSKKVVYEEVAKEEDYD